MWPNQQKNADLVTFTKEILSGKLHFFVQWQYPTSFDKISILTWRLLVELFFLLNKNPRGLKFIPYLSLKYSITVTEILNLIQNYLAISSLLQIAIRCYHQRMQKLSHQKTRQSVTAKGDNWFVINLSFFNLVISLLDVALFSVFRSCSKCL